MITKRLIYHICLVNYYLNHYLILKNELIIVSLEGWWSSLVGYAPGARVIGGSNPPHPIYPDSFIYDAGIKRFMDARQLSRYALVPLFLIIAYLAYVVIKPFISYLIFSVVLVVIFSPVYNYFVKKTKKPRAVALLCVLALLLLLVIPTYVIFAKFITEAPSAYENFVKTVDFSYIEEFMSSNFGKIVDMQGWLDRSTVRFQKYVLSNAASIFQSVTNIMMGLFVMFFVMYYMFIDGDYLISELKKILPISSEHQKVLLREIKQVIKGTIEGQLLLGIIQGALGGLIFLILGLSNPLFWGFLMVIFSIIPVIGAFIIWVPAAIYLFASGSIIKAIILSAFGIIVISQVDNLLRPYIMGRTAEIHPVIVLLGVLGGLQVFGFIGFITGPLVLALFMKVLRFFTLEVNQ